MVDAVASGVVFSRDPNRPNSNQVLIQAVKGLGVTLVDGRTSPEIVLVSRDLKLPDIARTPSSQESRMVLAPDSGMKEEMLEPGEADEPCLTDDEALQLARWAASAGKPLWGSAGHRVGHGKGPSNHSGAVETAPPQCRLSR